MEQTPQSSNHNAPAPFNRTIVSLLWVFTCVFFPVWMHFDIPAWDANVYRAAMISLNAGHDPYADAIAAQQLFHSQMALHRGVQGPFSYVYSPITLPMLRVAGSLPLWLSTRVYILFYVSGVLALIWFGLRIVEAGERRYFIYIAPVLVFFPGFLAIDNVLSGNIAYILYPLVLLTAFAGWRSGKWLCFYLAVICASCFKAPLLTLLAIPILSAPEQCVPSITTASAGLVMFFMQRLLWPSLFHNFLQAVELQFSYNRDFGVSPVGLFSGVLFDLGLPYSPASYLFFLCYVLPLMALLFYLSRCFLRRDFDLRQWMPVMLVGVILLNPRIMEYDVAPLTIPLALICWRFYKALASTSQALVYSALTFLTLNLIATQSWKCWKLTEGLTLVIFFLAGSWNLIRKSRVSCDASGANRASLGKL